MVLHAPRVHTRSAKPKVEQDAGIVRVGAENPVRVEVVRENRNLEAGRSDDDLPNLALNIAPPSNGRVC